MTTHRISMPSPGSRTITGLAAILATLFAIPSLAWATTITFDDSGFVNGQIVTGVPGVAIEANNFVLPCDDAIIFDTEQRHSRFPQLEARKYGLPRWSGGNLEGVQLNNVLVLDRCIGGRCGANFGHHRQATGTLRFVFDVPITSIGFDMINVTRRSAKVGSVTFTDINDVSVTITQRVLLACLQIGHNTANRIDPLSAEGLGLGPIKSVTFLMGGATALDNITYETVPEPATGLFLGLGLILLSGVRRQRAA